MLVKDAPIGTKLILGEYDGDDIIWVKVSDENDFVSETSVGNMQFDTTEYESNSRARRRFGNNFFPHSNICQWLNATGSNWYEPTHQYDQSPWYYDLDGFLSRFNAEELAAIEEREITVAVPLGSKKEFGQTYTMQCKVCLPSASELGYPDDDVAAEGVHLPEINNIQSRQRWNASLVTRTGIKDGGHIVVYFGNDPDSAQACKRHHVHPMIRMNGETEISDDGDIHSVQNKDFIKNFMELIAP